MHNSTWSNENILRNPDPSDPPTPASANGRLLIAAMAGDCGGIMDALDDGAGIESRNSLQMTPLMLAARGGHERAVAALLDAGADPEAMLSDNDICEVIRVHDLTRNDVILSMLAQASAGHPAP